ncbi:MAG: hypothetical protein IMW90_11100 [Thermogemmatispora sp.]|uniref:hypothetical protein n=1 Tax=Thermogemmatispora sp. TaxID=1968838 RepID=UPI001A0D891F|nr:hypothetical protein [Thermogemmatispora sp.]MBE3566263.1 hypothetical protein [Thermogemmatispora sp.]
MVSSWDLSLKRLFSLAAQDLITFVLPGASHVQQASGEFVLAIDPPLTELGALYADALSTCTLAGKPLLIHLEFQSRADPSMPQRLLMYNILADRRFGYPVLSCVIYLRRCGVPTTPYQRFLPDDSPVHEFYFRIVKLWELSAQALLARQLPGLLPLLPLSREGHSRQVIRTMIERLQQARQYELLEVGLLLASLAWADAPASERQWLQEQFTMLTEFLQELKQTDAARALIQEGRQEGLQEGLQKNRRLLVDIVSARFSSLSELAALAATAISDLDTLLTLTGQASTVPDAEHLRSLLLAHLPDNAGQSPTGNGSQP